MNIQWHPATEKPAAIPCTALIAVPDEEGDGYFLLNGIYTMTPSTHDKWVNESEDNDVITAEGFIWLLESDLLASLPPKSK